MIALPKRDKTPSSLGQALLFALVLAINNASRAKQRNTKTNKSGFFFHVHLTFVASARRPMQLENYTYHDV